MIGKILLISILIVGTYLAIAEFIWTFKKKEVDDYKGWYLKPLFTCVTCMASVWGSIYYVLLSGYDFNFIEWALTCIACAYVNTLLYKLIK
jgi:hypothetical protein